MRRLLIAFPYYEKDRAQAMRLAKFICDLEPKFRDDVTLFFYARHDALPITPHEMMRYITTFPVQWGISSTKAEGHPAGCNAMAADLFRHAQARVDSGHWADVDSILLCEPDCVPCARDWIDQLRAEWDRARELSPVLVVGCFRNRGVDVPHVNGNALWSPRLATSIAVGMDCRGLGWDSAWSEQLTGRSYPTSMIVNLWRETNVPEDRMATSPFLPMLPYKPVLIHGVKDRSAELWAEKQTGVKFEGDYPLTPSK